MKNGNNIVVKRDGDIALLTNGFVIQEQPNDKSKMSKRYFAAVRKAKTKNDFSGLREFQLVREDGSWYCDCADLWYEDENEKVCHWCLRHKPAIYAEAK